MTEVVYSDGSGATISLCKADGRHLTHSNSVEQWRAATEMKTRPDDVFICEYPKSGVHWMWEIVTMLRSGEATPIKDLMEHHMLDFIPAVKLLSEDQVTSPRTFTTHKYPQELPKMALEQNCKIIFLLRDPKDICVSYYHHLAELKSLKYEGKFESFIQLFLDGKVPFDSWGEYMKQWSAFEGKANQKSFFVIYFEDMKKNPGEQIRRLADFLDVDASDELVTQIATNTTFSSMKRFKEGLDNPLLSFFKSGKEIMFRKGEVGEWTNWFDDSQRNYYEEQLKSQLHGVHYDSLADLNRYLYQT